MVQSRRNHFPLCASACVKVKFEIDAKADPTEHWRVTANKTTAQK